MVLERHTEVVGTTSKSNYLKINTKLHNYDCYLSKSLEYVSTKKTLVLFSMSN